MFVPFLVLILVFIVQVSCLDRSGVIGMPRGQRYIGIGFQQNLKIEVVGQIVLGCGFGFAVFRGILYCDAGLACEVAPSASMSQFILW